MIRLLVLLMFCPIILIAQKKALSGIWILEDREVLSGPNYANGVPRQVIIDFQGKNIIMKRISDNDKNSQDTVFEENNLNSQPSVTITKSGKRKTSAVKFLSDIKFNQQTTYSSADNDNKVENTRLEDWDLSADGTTLNLHRKELKGNGDSVNWSMKAEYIRLEAAKAGGVAFTENLSWKQILEKAKKENKFIFVDCYATWCGPCKQMDRDVYPFVKTGNFFNNYFIPVKVQMDKAPKDNQFIKQWYKDAEQLQQQYHVDAFPTFLFFSPEGKLVHKGLGFLVKERLIDLAKQSMDSDQQYYTKIDAFRQGKLSQDKLKELVLQSEDYREKELALEIADAYLAKIGTKILETEEGYQFVARFSKSKQAAIITEKFLKGAPDSILYKKKNLLLLTQVTHSSKSFGFNILYRNSEKVNAKMGKDFSRNRIQYVITKEEIDPKLWKDGKSISSHPDWVKIAATIRKKYNDYYAKLSVFDAQMQWYNFHKDSKEWPIYCQTLIVRTKLYGPQPSGFSDQDAWSNASWELLKRASNKDEFLRAIEMIDTARLISEKILASGYNQIYDDVKGHILYKLGKTNEALEYLDKAKKNELKFVPEEESFYMQAMDKMRKGEASWPAGMYNEL
jgi:thioredoxin-related protein